MKSIDVFGSGNQINHISELMINEATNNYDGTFGDMVLHITDEVDIVDEQFRKIIKYHNISRDAERRLIECMSIIRIMEQEVDSIIYNLNR